MNKVIIQPTDNDGFVITYPNPVGDGTLTYCCAPAEAWEEPNITINKCKCIVDMLYTVKEGLGLYYSDHNSHNVVIKIEDSNGNFIED